MILKGEGPKEKKKLEEIKNLCPEFNMAVTMKYRYAL
jgi:hypothetical protein